MLQLFVNVKQLGKKKDVIHEKPFILAISPETVQELITAVVQKQVAEFNERPDEETFLAYLTPQSIAEQAEEGKVDFGVHYNRKKADETEAVRNALLAFQDGIFRLFLNDTELPDVAQVIELKEGDRLTFIRLTMLAGRMW